MYKRQVQLTINSDFPRAVDKALANNIDMKMCIRDRPFEANALPEGKPGRLHHLSLKDNLSLIHI